jgi:hypothetical protein
MCIMIISGIVFVSIATIVSILSIQIFICVHQNKDNESIYSDLTEECYCEEHVIIENGNIITKNNICKFCN